jgi:hypothetical protein
MTKDKAAKRATRARMAKTGERYTTARLYALDLHHSPLQVHGQEQEDEQAPVLLREPSSLERAADAEHFADSPPPTPDLRLPTRVAEPAVSDAAVQRATGKGWDEWFALLDAWDGTAKTHTDIARHVHEAYGVDGWWAQSIAVGYERARGMRAVHERPDGFSAGVSKTLPVPVERLFAAIVEDEERSHWMNGIALRRRTSQPNKSARFDVLPGDLRLSAYFTSKGAGKSSVQFQQERLPDAAAVEHWKTIWKEQFTHLAAYLADEVGSRKSEVGESARTSQQPTANSQ